MFKFITTEIKNIIQIFERKFFEEQKLFYNKKYLSQILKQIDKKKKNYLYYEWPFGGYVFDEMKNANYKGINLIGFSLFKLFDIENRSKLKKFVLNNFDEIEKLIIKSFKNKNIKAFLVTHDWHVLHENVINCFKKALIPSVCIIHEGVFQSKNDYYESKPPISDKTLVWGELLKSIFIERGYDSKNIEIVGSIKLNNYKYFQPKLPKSKFFESLSLDINKKTILYCCQLCDNQWGNQDYALSKQVDTIRALVDIAKNNDFNLIIRNAPASPKKILPKDFCSELDLHDFVAIDGKDFTNEKNSTYTTTAGDCIYYSDIIVGMNTTMQLEASILDKPAIVAQFFDFVPKWHNELGLPLCVNPQELEQSIKQNIFISGSLIQNNKKLKFYDEYGFYPDKNYNPLKHIEEFLKNI